MSKVQNTFIENQVELVEIDHFEDFEPKIQKKIKNSGFSYNNESTKKKDFPCKNSLQSFSPVLPISQFQSMIVEAIFRNKVIIISGDTGCGKSTQVPKYILNDCTQKDLKCKIICTQPRRMAAVTLANRVSRELGGVVGGVVGYHIGRENRTSEKTSITYVTNGIFLEALVHNKDILKELTHVILDEIHERDIDSDFIMIALKILLRDNPETKLILMSATINAEMFAKYFSRDQISGAAEKQENQKKLGVSTWNKRSRDNSWFHPQNTANEKFGWDQDFLIKKENECWETVDYFVPNEAPTSSRFKVNLGSSQNNYDFETNYRNRIDDVNAKIIKIPQANSKYKVTEKFLDDVEDMIGMFEHKFKAVDFDKLKPTLFPECVSSAVLLIKKIITEENKNRKNKGILVFLPGLNEIFNLVDMINENLSQEHLSQVKLIPLHSALSDTQIDEIFARKEKNITQIIIATNIAESSITVPNIAWVINFCLTKETNFNTRTGLEKLELAWSSKASCKQRAGRTGRVCDGVVFEMIPKKLFDALEPFASPEIKRRPLDRLMLRIKMLAEINPQSIFFDPVDVLEMAIQVPDVENIELALRSLQDAGALTWVDNEDHLKFTKITDLGKLYSDLPCDIKFSRLCVMGHVFDCLFEAVTLAAILQQRKSIYLISSWKNPRDRFTFLSNTSHFSKESDSDPISMLSLFQEWEKRFHPKLFENFQNGGQILNEEEAQFRAKKYFRKMLMKRPKNETQSDLELRQKEREFCEKYYLDYIVLKEVATLREDLRRRLNSYGFENSLFKNRLELCGETKEVADNNLRLKILLACSFNTAIIKADPMKGEKTEKELNFVTKYIKLDPQRILKVGTSENITKLSSDSFKQKEAIWRDFFSRYGSVEDIKFNTSNAYVLFDENSYQRAIKMLLARKSQKYDYYTGENSKDFKTFDQNEKEAMNNFYKSLGNFENLYLCRFHDFFCETDVTVDKDSINSIVISNKTRYLVAHDYQQRGNSTTGCRYTTLLPDYPIIIPIINLIFGTNPILKADLTRKRLGILVLNNYKLSLDYYLKQQDINEVNEIRNMLSYTLSLEGFKNSNHTSSFIWNKIKSILQKKRIKVLETEMWEARFRRSDLYMQILLPLERKKMNQIPKSTLVQKTTNSHSVFNAISLPEVDFHAFDVNTTEGEANYKKYRVMYNNWKQNTLRSLENLKKKLELAEAQIVCGHSGCNCNITSRNNLKDKYPPYFMHIAPKFYEIKEASFDPKDPFCSPKEGFFNLIAHITQNNYDLVSCFNGHIFGFKGKNENLWSISPKSDLKILYPDLNEEKLDIIKFDIAELLEKEQNAKFMNDIEFRNYNFYCELCFEDKISQDNSLPKRLENSNAFLKHVRSQEHKQNVELCEKSLSEESMYFFGSV